ncbi:retrovirus-related pol polyprotein from transposon TNT 1-94 [Tanacetum coccineum]
MSTTSAQQQLLADAGSEALPPMLERDRETQFNNEFDQFTTKAGESLMSVYNRFSQLPEWYKYVTNVFLVRNVKDEPYDVLFDYLRQYEKLVISLRAKKKMHDPLTLVAHTSSSYPYVVDYDDDYQGETFGDDQEDNITFVMMLLAFVQADRVNIQNRNVGNGGRIARRSYNTQEAPTESINVQKETRNVQRTVRISSSGNATNVQCYNCDTKGHYARDYGTNAACKER